MDYVKQRQFDPFESFNGRLHSLPQNLWVHFFFLIFVDFELFVAWISSLVQESPDRVLHFLFSKHDLAILENIVEILR